MRNHVSKNMGKFNKASTHRDKKNDYSREEEKAKILDELDEFFVSSKDDEGKE